MNVAIIPARGGSKRVPRKNIRQFCGQPMIAWSIQAAIKSKLFDQVFVSTDDLEIANESKKFGAQIPFLRPAELSDDNTVITSVISHAINELTNQGLIIDKVCCIFATAPLIHQSDLITCLNKLNDDRILFSFPVTNYPAPIQRAIKINSNGLASMFNPNAFNSRSQDLEPAFYDAGQFYWGKSKSWLNNKYIFSEISSPLIIPSYRVQDIDSEDDWIRAEMIFNQFMNHS